MADDIAAIEAVIQRQFGSLNWTPETRGDWRAFVADFLPGAVLYPAARPAVSKTPEEFVDRMWSMTTTSLRSFNEKMLGRHIHVFGNVAVAVTGCEMIDNGTQVSHGVEMMLLVKTGGAWKIAAQAWDTGALPADLQAVPD
jgi:hypothetical protein